jgi:hypothetical protein
MTQWARFRSADGRVGFGVLGGDRIVEEVLNEDVSFPQWCRSKGYDTTSQEK